MVDSFPTRDQIQIGVRVRIETRDNQGTGILVDGIVTEILTSAMSHPHGIKVRLEDGQVGRVKKMLKRHFERILQDSVSISDQANFQITLAPNTSRQSALRFVDLYKKEIPKKENRNNEFKEFYQYDKMMDRLPSIDVDEKNKVLRAKKLEVQARFATAICSFGNGDGGFVYLGVKSDGTIVGLEKDKAIGNFADYDDEFANHIVTRLKEFIRDNIFIINKIKIVFRQVDDKTVCLVQVLPSALPLYLHRNKIKEFYVRGSAPRAERLDGLDQARYIQKRFPDLS